MNKKQQYRDFCKSEQDIPIFAKDWWLDAVCGESNWDVALVFNKSDDIIASMPYAFKRKFGKLIIRQPPLTQHNGFYIKYPLGQGYTKRLTYEIRLMRELCQQIPRFLYYSQNFPNKFGNFLAFRWKQFKLSVKYTYIIRNCHTIDSYETNCVTAKRRNSLKKALKQNLRISESDNLKVFYGLNLKTYQRQGLSIPYSFQLVDALFKSIKNHNSGKIYIAYNEQNVPVAAIFLVEDNSSVYYLMGGVDEEYKHLCAMELLIDFSIKYALQKGKNFDFEGSMVEKIEKLFRSFGAEQVPYFNMAKSTSKTLSMLLAYRGK